MLCKFPDCPRRYDYLGLYDVVYESKRTDFHQVQVNADHLILVGSVIENIPIHCKVCDHNGSVFLLPEIGIVIVYVGDDHFIAKKRGGCKPIDYPKM